jgi:hypothetical protein
VEAVAFLKISGFSFYGALAEAGLLIGLCPIVSLFSFLLA